MLSVETVHKCKLIIAIVASLALSVANLRNGKRGQEGKRGHPFHCRPAVSYQNLPALAEDMERQQQQRGWGVCLEPHVLIPVLISASDMIGSLASGVRLETLSFSPWSHV